MARPRKPGRVTPASGGAFAAVVSLATSACAAHVPLEVWAARVEEAKCSSPGVEGGDERMVETLQVERADSSIHSATCSGVAQVFGVVLVVRRPEGVSAGQLAAALQCRAARARRGEIDRSRVPDDPFWLPDSWVEIEVTDHAGDPGRLVITLRGDTVGYNLEILPRARAF